MYFAIVFNFFIALVFDGTAVFQRKLIQGVFEIFVFHQYALKNFRIKSEGGATLQAHIVSV
jgi:hypothetical protein